jgi:tetratricopeptide (TPR) repeat protein
MAQGQTAFKARQYAEAVQFLTAAKDLFADAEVTELLIEANFQANVQLGRQRIEETEYTAAIKALDEAIRLKPDHAESRKLLQKANEGKKQQDKAAYDRAMAAGDAAMLRSDYQAATQAYREALTKQPRDGAASSKLSTALQKAQEAKKQQDKAEYDRAMMIGDTAMLRGDYEAAINAYREALNRQPQDGSASFKLSQAQSSKMKMQSYTRHISLGKTQLSFKNYFAAQTEFQAALFDKPGDLEAQRLLQQARQGKR